MKKPIANIKKRQKSHHGHIPIKPGLASCSFLQVKTLHTFLFEIDGGVGWGTLLHWLLHHSYANSVTCPCSSCGCGHMHMDCGTTCLRMSHLLSRWPHSASDWRPICFWSPIPDIFWVF